MLTTCKQCRIMWSAVAGNRSVDTYTAVPTPHNQEHHISQKMLSSTSFDGQGYWLAQKRLSRGRFRWWPEGAEAAKALQVHEAQLLMAAGDISRVRAAPLWRPVSPPQ